MPHAFWIFFLFTLGACVGSFLNVVIHRVPRNQSIVFPPSHCPRCGKGIRWHDNIPLLSWILLKGRCRFCKCEISPRYLVIEAVTAFLVAGLYVCYYVLDLRAGTGRFLDSWPMFAAHAALLCGLLACAMVDIECWIVPLEVCWVVSLGGVLAAALSPHAFLLVPLKRVVKHTLPGLLDGSGGIIDAGISPAAGALAWGGLLGLAIAVVLLRYGYIRQSFIDASDRELEQDPPDGTPSPKKSHAAPGKGKKKKKAKDRNKDKAREPAGPVSPPVHPRREIFWELLFLLPAGLLAVAAVMLVTKMPAVKTAWNAWHTTGPIARNLSAVEACVFGYLIGGLWIWGMRILGTLAFGRLAMGMGDVHLLAAVGAVAGWIVPSAVFFIAPVFGLAWAVRLWAAKAQKELPYGPWLALATLVVLVFHDPVVGFFAQYGLAIGLMMR